MVLERLRLKVRSSAITPNCVVIIESCPFPSLAFAVFPDYFFKFEVYFNELVLISPHAQ